MGQRFGLNRLQRGSEPHYKLWVEKGYTGASPCHMSTDFIRVHLIVLNEFFFIPKMFSQFLSEVDNGAISVFHMGSGLFP